MPSFSIGCFHPGRSFIAVIVGDHPKTSVINCFLYYTSHYRHGWLTVLSVISGSLALDLEQWSSLQFRSSHLPISTFSLNQPALNWPSLTTIAIILSSPNKSFPTYNISYYSFFTIHFRSKNKSKVLHSQPLSAITNMGLLIHARHREPVLHGEKRQLLPTFYKGTHRLLTPCNAQWRLFHSISS